MPLGRILPAAVARLRDVEREVADHGAIVETTFTALGYLAEANSDDEVQQLRVAKARGEYEHAIRGIDRVNEVRRIARDLRARKAADPAAEQPDAKPRAGRSRKP